jgi:hypothetical protein
LIWDKQGTWQLASSIWATDGRNKLKMAATSENTGVLYDEEAAPGEVADEALRDVYTLPTLGGDQQLAPRTETTASSASSSSWLAETVRRAYEYVTSPAFSDTWKRLADKMLYGISAPFLMTHHTHLSYWNSDDRRQQKLIY